MLVLIVKNTICLFFIWDTKYYLLAFNNNNLLKTTQVQLLVLQENLHTMLVYNLKIKIQLHMSCTYFKLNFGLPHQHTNEVLKHGLDYLLLNI